MSKKVFLLFIHLEDGAYCAGVYDSIEKCEEAIAKIETDMEEELEDDFVDIVETELNQLIDHPVVEFEDEEGDDEA